MTAGQVDLAVLVGDTVDIACEWGKCDRPAVWIVWANHDCEKHQRHGFLCATCLQALLTMPTSLHCEVTREVWSPARTWISRFEAIRHKPTSSSGGSS